MSTACRERTPVQEVEPPRRQGRKEQAKEDAQDSIGNGALAASQDGDRFTDLLCGKRPGFAKLAVWCYDGT